MKDKLIIIATIQYVLDQMKMLIGEPGSMKNPTKLAVLTTLGVVLIQFHMAITGDHWQGSPKDLMLWMVKYIKNEADGLGHQNRITIALN